MEQRREGKDGSNTTVPAERQRVTVAVVGCGYWGPNLVRNFSACPLTEVAAVCDRDPVRLQACSALSPRARAVEDFNEVLADGHIEAVVIATPARTHAALARAALLAGKHVLVEKPLATALEDAGELV